MYVSGRPSYMRMAPILNPDALALILKGRLKSGSISTSVVVMVALSLSKEVDALSNHWKTSFSSKEVSGALIFP